jgi:hypothetical protein
VTCDVLQACDRELQQLRESEALESRRRYDVRQQQQQQEERQKAHHQELLQRTAAAEAAACELKACGLFSSSARSSVTHAAADADVLT